LLLAGLAQAQSGDGLRVAAAAGSSDYGTGLKVQISNRFKPSFLNSTRSAWRWEAQAVSFGRETYSQFGNSYQRSAWALGGSVVPMLTVGYGLTAYGKLGAHYLRAEASGPGLSADKSNFKLGYGAGLLWQALPMLGVKLELENIGGSGGDLVTVGLEVPL
jgi:hypothetical protein